MILEAIDRLSEITGPKTRWLESQKDILTRWKAEDERERLRAARIKEEAPSPIPGEGA